MKYHSTAIKIIFVLILSTLLSSGCNQKSSNKIGLLIHDMEGRWFSDVKYLKQSAEESGLEIVTKNAMGDENLQIAQVKELVNEKVETIILIAVNQYTAAGIVRIAKDNNIKVIAYDRMISNADIQYFISYDHQKIGELQAKYCLSKVPKGNYVMFWGDPSDNNAVSIRKGQEKIINPLIRNGEINMVYRTYTDGWSKNNASHKMKQILNYTSEPIDAVIASNDIIALGVIEAFKEQNLKLPKVITGLDLIYDSYNSIKEGEQTMTIFKSSKEMASETISIAIKLINNKLSFKGQSTTYNKRKEVPTLFLEPYIVDKMNINEYSNIHTKQEKIDQNSNE